MYGTEIAEQFIDNLGTGSNTKLEDVLQIT